MLYVGGTSIRLSQERVEEGDLHPEEAGGDGLLQDGAPPQSAQVSGPGPAACCSSRKSLLKHLKPLSFEIEPLSG